MRRNPFRHALALLGITLPMMALADRAGLPAQAATHSQAESRVDFIETGCAGGVTGGSTAYRLTRTGELTAVHRSRAAAAAVTTRLRDDAADLAQELFARVEQDRVLGSRQRTTGSMTCWFKVSLAGKNHEFSWARGGNPPRTLLELHQRLQSAGRAAEAALRAAPGG